MKEQIAKVYKSLIPEKIGDEIDKDIKEYGKIYHIVHLSPIGSSNSVLVIWEKY